MNWWKLRAVGNLKLLKVSYVVLGVIPLLSHYDKVVVRLGFKPWFLGAVFFASLFLALANLIYDIACPTIVKRFASPNDLYSEMLAIKEKSQKLYLTDKFDASHEHCISAYTNAANANPGARYLCLALFLSAGFLFAIIFGYRSFLVLEFVARSFCC